MLTHRTLAALGLNPAGIRKAWFRVYVVRSTAGQSLAYRTARYSTVDAANAAVQAHAAAGERPTVEVWWNGDATPVRTWGP